MDPLHQEDEQMATLEELFEFIDCCITPHEYSDKPPRQESPKAVDQVKPSTTNTTAPTKAKRKRTGWSSSTGLQRRKRAEIQFLREHIRDLEAFAEDLKQRADSFHVGQNEPCNWQELAAVEYKERLKAEKTNLVLRKIQQQVSAILKLIAETHAVT